MSLTVHTNHTRSWRENRFVYPVISRRSRGVSIGVNLNPDKVCNFDCIYCQVNRREEAETKFVATEQMLAELEGCLELVTSGRLFDDERFAATPPPLRRLNDIAFAGDGEPTSFRNFDLICGEVADLKHRLGLPDVKLVLITNASMFHRPACQRALRILDRNQGEIWAKLDAGTDEYYQLVCRTKIPFRQILDNLTAAAQDRPLVIQSLFQRISGEPPGPAEIQAYCERLREIQQAGGQLSLLQIYTVSRPPTESYVTPLTVVELQAIAEQARQATGVEVATFA